MTANLADTPCLQLLYQPPALADEVMTTEATTAA